MSLFAPKGGKGLKFANIGDSHTGKIVSEPREQQMTKFGTDIPDTWPNGDPKMQIVVDLETSEREDANDDGRRSLYVSSQKMKFAIFQAIQAAGVDDLKIGGTLTVTYTGTDPNSKNPANPAKLYNASYVPPQSAFASTPQAATPAPAQVAAQDEWNPPAAPATAAAPQQATPAATGEKTLFDKVKELINVGLDDESISNATNATVEQVAAIRAA